MSRPLNATKLKAAVLAICDQRITACRDAEARYMALSKQSNGGILGTVDLAHRAVATERSARLEADLIRRLVDQLQAAQ